MVSKVILFQIKLEIPNNNSASSRTYSFEFRISDNVYLPGQPSYDVPNDAYETVHLPKHDILEESLKREV